MEMLIELKGYLSHFRFEQEHAAKRAQQVYEARQTLGAARKQKLLWRA
jgi:hypothetical protein